MDDEHGPPVNLALIRHGHVGDRRFGAQAVLETGRFVTEHRAPAGVLHCGVQHCPVRQRAAEDRDDSRVDELPSTGIDEPSNLPIRETSLVTVLDVDDALGSESEVEERMIA